MSKNSNANVFREEEIIPELSHRLPEFLEMVRNGIRISDFRPFNYFPAEQKMLTIWRIHLAKYVPYAVTRPRGTNMLILWKKDERARTREEKEAERAKPGARWFRESDNTPREVEE